MKKILFLIGLLAVSTCFAVEATLYYTDPLINMTTGITAQPSFSTISDTYCVNDQLTPSISIQSAWYSPDYYGILRGNAVTAGCVQSYAGTASNQGINWLSQANFDTLKSGSSWEQPLDTFVSYISPYLPAGRSLILSDESSTYRTSAGNLYSGKQGEIGVFCKGTASIDSNIPGYAPSSEYLGSTLPMQVVSLPAGTYTITPKFSLSDCFSTGMAYTVPSCSVVQAVLLYKNGPQISYQFSGASKSITVENKFTCSATIAGANPNPATVSPGGSSSVSFNIVNNAVRPIHIDSISLSTESQQYFDPAGTIFTPPTGDIDANGGTGPVSGTIKVLSSTPAGTYQLNLSIAYHSTQADCANLNNVQCSSPHTVTITVIVPPQQTCSLAFATAVPGNNIVQGTTAPPIVAACSPSPCPALTWTHTASAATTLLPHTTPAQASPQSILAVAASEPVGSYAVNASSGSLVCTGLPFNVVSPQQTCTLAFVGSVPGSNIAPGGSAQIAASCQNPSTCPALAWTQTAGTLANLAPASTPSGTSPQTTLSISMSASAHNGYSVNASSGSLVCTGLPFNVAIPSSLPDYIIPFIKIQPIFPYVGETFTALIDTQNIGGADATVPSYTSAAFQSQNKHISPVPALDAGANYTGVVGFTCLAKGTSPLSAYADAGNAILESDETNNANSIQAVTCYSTPVSCVLAMVNHGVNFTKVDQAYVDATCYDSAGAQTLCPNLAWSEDATGEVYLTPTDTQRSVSPSSLLYVGSGVSAQLGKKVMASSNESQVPLTCTPVQFNINPYAPGTYTVNCSFPGYGVNPAFFNGQSATVLASCTKNGATYCPALSWTTTLPGATLQPSQTADLAAFQQSTLSMPSAEPLSVEQGSVTIACADQIECTLSADCQFIFSPRPTNMTCGIIDHAPQFSPNDSAILQANCTKTGVSGFVACPQLDWEAIGITHTHFDPNPTDAGIQPTTNFSTISAPAPQSGSIDASSATSGITLSCANPILADISNIGPDYAVIWVKPPPDMMEPGKPFHVSVNVTNLGNQNVSVDTQTVLLGANCSGTDQFRTTGGLHTGESSVIEDYTCICNSLGTFEVTAVADYGNAIHNDLNKLNNRNSGTYVCGIAYAPVCSDYI